MTDGFGAFGKLPSMGDFLRLNLAADFVQAWDEWLQTSIVAMRDRMGNTWNDHYLSAPIWRFTLPGGHAGKKPMSGIMMASVDRVGRQFPLALAAPHATNDLALMHFANRGVFEQLEEIALTILEEETPRDGVAAAITAVQLVQPMQGDVAGDQYAGALSPESILAAQSVNQRRPGYALWSTSMVDDQRLLLCPDLPDANQIHGMFDLNAPIWGKSAEVQYV